MDLPYIDVDQVVEELLSDSSSDDDGLLGFSNSGSDSGHGSPLSAESLSDTEPPYNDLVWNKASQSLWETITDDVGLVNDSYTMDKQIPVMEETHFSSEIEFLDSPVLNSLPQNENDIVDNITVDVDWDMDMSFLDNPVKSEPLMTGEEKAKDDKVPVEKVEVKPNTTQNMVVLNTAVKAGSGQALTGILLRPVKNGNVTTYITVPVSVTSVKDNQKVEKKEIEIKETCASKEEENLTLPVEDEKKFGNFSVSQGIGPNLTLTNEEKRLLDMEGVSLPTDMPLTKAEEKVLKKVRRKIKNKQSAMESRRRRKDYIDNLEKRVKDCTDRNLQLRKQVIGLTDENKSLGAQLKELQALIASSLTQSKNTQTGACLAVLLLSFALFFVPFNPSSTLGKAGVVPGADSYSGAVVRSRTLLEVDDNTEYDYHDDSNVSDPQHISSLLESLKLEKESPLIYEQSGMQHKGSIYLDSPIKNNQDVILSFADVSNETERRTL